MFKKLLLPSIALFLALTTCAQTLYVPRDIAKAYKKETRSTTGKPGKNYWQNHGRYDIHVNVAPPNRNITGIEEIVYTNNSPDTLRSLNMKLIMNIHRPGAARVSPANPRYLTDGMQIDTFMVDKQVINWNNIARAATNSEVVMAKPLMPHDSVRLHIAWHYQLSLESGREGMIDSTTYYLAYFYPRIAVYDDYNGWDKLTFNDFQEFYNDFNDYKLSVTVPKNYLVWSTGTLQNAGQVLQPKYADRLSTSFKTDSTLHVVTTDDLLKKDITNQNATNTWVWTANNITDVAFGVSDHYVWDAGSTIADKATGRRASMQAAYKSDSEDFKHSVQWGLYAFKWFADSLPGVPYPFPKMTAFQGFSDMEYPMMVNDSHSTDLQDSRLTQDHEMAHTYFPFYMGINETRYGFMDEGWATTLEYQLGAAENGQKYGDDFYKRFRIRGYTKSATTSSDIPLIIPSSETTQATGNNEYNKPSLSYLALQDMLGYTLFKRALYNYMENWHGKHPMPWDYFHSMSTGAGKNLNWFFTNWFFTNNYIDIAIEKVTPNAKGAQLEIKNVGGFAIPFNVVVTYADGRSKTYHQTPAVWEHNQTGFVMNLTGTQAITAIKLDNGVFLDTDESNNAWKK